MRENSKKTKAEFAEEGLQKMKQLTVFAYLVCMLGVFPLYYKEQYYKIGDAKFGFFWKVSLGFLGIMLVCDFAKTVLKWVEQKSGNKARTLYKDNALEKNLSSQENTEKQERKKLGVAFLKFLQKLSNLDYAVLIYAICVILSYCFSDFKEFALKGAPGWEMGLCSQLIFVALYFILSRQTLLESISVPTQKSSKNKIVLSQRNFAKAILVIHLTSSALTFGLGILHRFDVDPLGMYEGLELYQKVEFLSTIGQATWFSGYVCTVLAIGMTIFYNSNRRWVRAVTGIYTIIGFGILVTQNSDSAFIAIAGILLLLGYFSLNNKQSWCRFLEIICLMWGTFGGIGILQKMFEEQRIPLDSLSQFLSQSIATWIMLAVSILLLVFYKYGCKSEVFWKRITREIYEDILLCIGAAVLIMSVFIYLNTKGYLWQWFGYHSTHPYLLFDYHWGSNRGSTWMVCWQAFVQMPLHQKLFGVGPDSLWAYFESVPEIKEFLYSLWGSLRVTNAHNEYLNHLLCYGLVGVTAWLAVLIGGIRYFYKKAKENPVMIGFALCITGYACHNIFCYQQVCATPILFIVLGIGESLTKLKNFNTIK